MRTITLFFVGLFLVVAVTMAGSAAYEKFPITKSTQAYTSHAPISITGDVALAELVTTEGWEGEGTAEDPFIVRLLWIVTVDGTPTIKLQNINSHVLIEYNKFEETVSNSAYGIELVNCSNLNINHNIFLTYNSIYSHEGGENINITNNQLVSKYYGIIMIGVNIITVQGNSFQKAFGSMSEVLGLLVISCKNHIITNNTFRGIRLSFHQSHSILFHNNTIEYCSDASGYTAELQYTSDINISHNVFQHNSNAALSLLASNTTTITKNIFNNNSAFALSLYAITNMIYQNSFIDNGASTSSHQVTTGVGGNLWSLDGVGNYWSDYDESGKYQIFSPDSSVLVYDEHPLELPVDIYKPSVVSYDTDFNVTTSQMPFRINWTVSDENPTSCDVYNGTAFVETITWEGGLGFYEVLGLVEGEYSFKFVFKDKDGNSASFTSHFYIEEAKADLPFDLDTEQMIEYAPYIAGGVIGLGVVLIVLKKVLFRSPKPKKKK